MIVVGDVDGGILVILVGVSVSTTLSEVREKRQVTSPWIQDDFGVLSASPAEPPFRALSGRLNFTARRHKFN